MSRLSAPRSENRTRNTTALGCVRRFSRYGFCRIRSIFLSSNACASGPIHSISRRYLGVASIRNIAQSTPIKLLWIRPENAEPFWRRPEDFSPASLLPGSEPAHLREHDVARDDPALFHVPQGGIYLLPLCRREIGIVDLCAHRILYERLHVAKTPTGRLLLGRAQARRGAGRVVYLGLS